MSCTRSEHRFCAMDESKQRKTMETTFVNRNWGYVVCFGTIITFAAGIGHVNSFGLIYNDFMNDTHSTARSLTTAHGVFSIMLAVGGMILNNLTKRLSLRCGGVIGAILFCIGSFTSILVTNTNQMPFTFGVLQGIGFGMMVPVCYSNMNYYYVKKRTTVMSICKAIQGIFLMWYPQLLKKIMNVYGFRGTLLVIAGISLHTFPGMIAMKTVNKPARQIRTANDVEESRKRQENDALLLSKEGEVRIADGSDPITNNLCGKMRLKLMDLFNVKILNDAVYCNICIGQSFVNFSDLTFFILQPMLLFQYHYDKTQVATCISICTAADVAGRCVLAVFSNFVPVNTRFLYYLATLITFVIRLVMLQIRQFFWIAVVTGVLGVMRAWLHVTSPLVISNHVTHENFPGAYALFMLAAGLVNVTFSPLVGLLKDVYEDYVPTFYALTLCCVPCLLLWPVEYIVKTK